MYSSVTVSFREMQLTGSYQVIGYGGEFGLDWYFFLVSIELCVLVM